MSIDRWRCLSPYHVFTNVFQLVANILNFQTETQSFKTTYKFRLFIKILKKEKEKFYSILKIILALINYNINIFLKNNNI